MPHLKRWLISPKKKCEYSSLMRQCFTATSQQALTGLGLAPHKTPHTCTNKNTSIHNHTNSYQTPRDSASNHCFSQCDIHTRRIYAQIICCKTHNTRPLSHICKQTHSNPFPTIHQHYIYPIPCHTHLHTTHT